MSVRVSSWVWEHSTVKHRGDLLVLLALADHAHDDGSSAYPSVETLGRKARLSRRGVFDTLARLKDEGAVIAEGHGPRGVVAYRIVMSDPQVQPLHGAATAPVQAATPGGAVTSTQGVQPTAPKPSVEPSTEPPASRERDGAGGATSSIDDDHEHVAGVFAELAATGIVRVAGDARRAVDIAREHDLEGAELRAFADEFAASLEIGQVDVAASVFAHRVQAGDHRAAATMPGKRKKKPWDGALGQALADQRAEHEVLPLIPDIVEAFGAAGRGALITSIAGIESNLRRGDPDVSVDAVAAATRASWQHLLQVDAEATAA